MSEKKKSNWIDKMKDGIGKETKIYNEVTNHISEGITNSTDGLFYSVLKFILSSLCIVAGILIYAIVFKESLGIFLSILLFLGGILVPSSMSDMFEKKEIGTDKKLSNFWKFYTMFSSDIVYIIVLYKYIDFRYLVPFIVGCSLISMILYFVKYERTFIYLGSIKSIGVELLFAYALYSIVDLKWFVCLVALSFIPVLVNSNANAVLRESTKNKIEKELPLELERELSEKLNDNVKVEFKRGNI